MIFVLLKGVCYAQTKEIINKVSDKNTSTIEQTTKRYECLFFSPKVQISPVFLLKKWLFFTISLGGSLPVWRIRHTAVHNGLWLSSMSWCELGSFWKLGFSCCEPWQWYGSALCSYTCASSVLLRCFFSASSVLFQCFFGASSVLLQCFFSASSVLLQ